MKDFEKVGQQLLPSVAYGDATGLPHERGEPLPLHSINGLSPVLSNPYLGEYPVGTWSDDTQLSLAVNHALVEAEAYDLKALVRAHIKALNHLRGDEAEEDWIPAIVTRGKNNGWGGSTTKSIDRLAAGVDPSVSGEPNGAGNGVLMKMAPLVYWQVMRGTPAEEADRQVVELSQMTHAAPEATVSSLVHRAILAELLLADPKDIGKDFFADLYIAACDKAMNYERLYDSEHKTSKVLHRIYSQVSDWRTQMDRQVILDNTPEKGFYAPETLLMAYGSFIGESVFPHSVFRAVELSGDSDSVGSIVSAMSACLYADREEPEDMEQLFAYERLQRASSTLAMLALK